EGGDKNEYYFIIRDPETLADMYAPQVSVMIINESAKTLRISFQDGNPQKTGDVVAAIAQEFIDYDVERRSESAKKALAFIDEQLGSVQRQLKTSEDSLRQIRSRKQIRDNETSNSFNMNRFGNLEDQLIRLQLEESILREIAGKLNLPQTDVRSMLALLAGTESAATLSSPLSNLYRLSVERQEMMYSMTESSESVKAMDYQIAIQKNIVIQSVNSLLEQSSIRRRAVENKLNEIGAQLPSPEQDMVDYNSMQRQYNINEKFFTMLLDKKTEYSISEAGFTAKHIILDKATIPSTPIKPSRRSAIITCLLLAIVASFVLIVVRYIFHDKIGSLNEIMKHTQASISALGIVPKYKEDIPVSQLLVDRFPKSLIAEAFRSLRTNLQFISNEEGSKVMAITSTISGEGKTFIAINLAGIIAYSGKRVIVIDLDMRKPKIHLGFNAPNEHGMSTLLIGRDTIESCVQKSAIDSLHFITAGPIPP
ncbi:MAG: GumC family protein, partial [Bacteroidia bacterium]